MAEITLAFQYLQRQQIAFRDLKPENVLIDVDGHIRIADFGFAKKIVDKSYTLCGTPEYLAPEVIMGQGHNQGVDWWSAGILMYEMLSGYPPFYDSNSYEIYKRIVLGYYEFSDDITEEARDLISKLLEKDVTKRLGCQFNGAEGIKSHEWFKCVVWDVVEGKRI
jgi:protein kinase X